MVWAVTAGIDRFMSDGKDDDGVYDDDDKDGDDEEDDDDDEEKEEEEVCHGVSLAAQQCS